MRVARYYAGWDHERIGAFDFDVSNDGSGANYAAINYTTGTHYHDLVDGTGYTSFAARLQASLEAARVAAGSPGSWTVAWENDNLRYVITRIGAAGSWSATLNTVAQNLLGMAASIGPIAGAHNSTVRPYYVIATTTDAISDSTGERHPEEGIVSVATTLDGQQFAVGVTTRPIHHDWWQYHEPIAAVRIPSATAAVPWTYEHLFTHVSSWEPIVAVWTTSGLGLVYDDTNVTIRFKLRGDGAAWSPVRWIADSDERFNVPFRAVVLERLS